MKKDELLGMEVYYEDNPQPHYCPTGPEGQVGPKGVAAPLPVSPFKPEGVWVFGDSDDDDVDVSYQVRESLDDEDDFGDDVFPKLLNMDYNIYGLKTTADLVAIDTPQLLLENSKKSENNI